MILARESGMEIELEEIENEAFYRESAWILKTTNHFLSPYQSTVSILKKCLKMLKDKVPK